MVWETLVQSQFASRNGFSITIIVFASGQGDLGSIPVRLKKGFLMPPYLTLRYGSRLRGAIQRKDCHSLQHLGVEAFEKEAFELPSTTVSQLTICFHVFISISNNLRIVLGFQYLI